MSKQKSFSVIIPCFNSEKYLAKALESIITTNYDKNLVEVLIVDDGSTDSTFKIAKEFAKNYFYIKAYTKENNHWGSVINYVKNNKLATKEYVSILDSDDFYDLNTFKNLNEAKNSDLLIGDFKYFDGVKTKRKQISNWYLSKKYKTKKRILANVMPLIYFVKYSIFYSLENLPEKKPFQDANYCSLILGASKTYYFLNKVIGYYFWNRIGNTVTSAWDSSRKNIYYENMVFMAKNEQPEMIFYFYWNNFQLRKIMKKEKWKFVNNKKMKLDFFPLTIRWFFWIWLKIVYKKIFKPS